MSDTYTTDRTLADWSWDMFRRSDDIGKLLPRANSPEQRQYMLGRMAAFEEAGRVLRQASRIPVASKETKKAPPQ